MKADMERITNYSIDIAKNPSEAIQKISNPILRQMNEDLEEKEEVLKENMAKKKELRSEQVRMKNQIFEEKTKRINYKQKLEENKIKKQYIGEDINLVVDQTQNFADRKNKLVEQVEELTNDFK